MKRAGGGDGPIESEVKGRKGRKGKQGRGKKRKGSEHEQDGEDKRIRRSRGGSDLDPLMEGGTGSRHDTWKAVTCTK